MRRLIVTGDDFGASPAVNEAIEQAHRRGILSTASLMVGEAAAADAVARAHSLPGLNVGLHVVVVRGRAVLPPEQIPELVGADGTFRDDLVRAGFHYFFNPRARAQLAREIRAQFEAFARTGLRLDHVNAHNHMHVHPTVLGAILRVGREFGLRAVRIPREPAWASWRATREHLVARLASSLLLAPWTALMRLRLRRAGVCANDYVLGMSDTGRMFVHRVLGYLACLPQGVTELYFHPAVRTRPNPGSDPGFPGGGSSGEGELAALTDYLVVERLRSSDIRRISFADLSATPPE